jgi:tripartite-type tricarboxylate transporter receptor subunit TctC
MTDRSRLIFGLVALLIAENGAAQTHYPAKPIRLIVGFPPGSQPDIVARLLGQNLTESWEKPVLIDNVTGAAGNIATERVAKATADGYTLGLLSQSQLIINPNLYKLAYDPVKDLTAISQVTTSANMLVVHNAVAAKNVQELIKLASVRPGELTFASGGSGTSTHMAAELLKSAAGVDIRHIPYKGVTAAIPDLLGGRVTMMFSPVSSVLPLVREGKLRALAVTSLRRAATFPDVPTVEESGYPGFEVTLWFGLLGPARLPPATVRKLHLETVKLLSVRDLRTKLADQGLEGIGNSPAEFAAVIRSELPKWAKVIKESGIKLE